jgi:hypothetical protein
MLEHQEYPKVLTTQKSEGAENQQGTDLAWLAGILDGEGSIGLYKNGNGKNYVRVTITNTDPLMYVAIKKILHHHLIPVYIIMDGQDRDKGWRDKWRMAFTGNTAPTRLLTTILPFLISKKEEAELALEYIRSRSSYPKFTKAPLTERELWIVGRMKELKQGRPLRDYMQDADLRVKI